VFIPKALKNKVLKMYMLENPTERSLHEIKIEEKKKAIEDKIGDIEQDYEDLTKMLQLRMRTVGEVANKLLKGKYKIIV
jgi:hypothetical protein